MSNKNEIVTKLIIAFSAFTLGFLLAVVGMGLLIVSDIKEALTTINYSQNTSEKKIPNAEISSQ